MILLQSKFTIIFDINKINKLEIMDFVEKGDIILLEHGMIVQYAKIPVYFYKKQNPYSTKFCEGHLHVGIEEQRKSFPAELRETIEKTIQFLFFFHEVPLDGYILARFVKNQVPSVPTDSLKIPIGEYLVTQVNVKDNVRKVFCQTHNAKPGMPVYELSFYQNSNFYATINKVQVIGKLGT